MKSRPDIAEVDVGIVCFLPFRDILERNLHLFWRMVAEGRFIHPRWRIYGKSGTATLSIRKIG